MKGYWHIPSISVLFSAFTVIFDSVVFSIVLLLWLLYLYVTRRLGKIPLTLSLTAFLFFTVYFPRIEIVSSPFEPLEMSITGQIITPISNSEKVIQFNVREDKTNQLIKIIYFKQNENESDFFDVQLGASCHLSGEVSLPVGSTNPGQFNYQKYLAANGIQYEMKINSSQDMICQGKASKTFLYSLREKLKNYITEAYSDKTSAWIIALVLGDDSQIPEETTEHFQSWGLSHILAISGLHIGLVVGFYYFLTFRLSVLTKEKAQLLIFIFLPIYAVLAGGEPSVWRATLMVLFVVIIQKIKIRFSVTDIISITFLILLLLDKYWIYHVGFQFSFLVSFGIILSRKWIGKDQSLFMQLVRLSFVSQMIIVPLQLMYFYAFNPLSILLNVIVVPYFSFFVIPFMFILLIISPIPFVATSLDWLFTMIHQYLFLLPLEVVNQLAYFPWWSGSFPAILVVLYYGLYLMMMYFVQKGVHRRAFLYGIFVTLVLFFVAFRPYISPYGTVTMLDIGQGDAFVIELPYRKGVLIVDAGSGFTFETMEPSKTNYTRIIKPFLQYKGIREIDGIVISHEDIDHAGSVNYLLEDFDVNTIMISEYYQIEEGTEKKWQRNGTDILRLKAGNSFELSGSTFTILSPWVDKKGSNENSLVIFTELGNKSWLFTGDIDKDVEREIIRNYPNLKVEVLKIAHHGSNTSSDPFYISAINPTYALISVGENNRYGHPSNEIISLLEKENIHVFRTDLEGAIIYQFTEDTGTFYRFKP
ncbi:DNA internalization-related competence protein ComEC/Rec2 [Ornithinibacillus bavariensis]|uniref:DNA internalization-related competence protein ComEC/Rec2 n=1 Tax=Ornithinibacillus bavariensis TaxID=545502 RepID=UPI000ED42C93|nr:DNA internalization-related competence protein ComEC/Rec2 [Ornithinibacillus sp.]